MSEELDNLSRTEMEPPGKYILPCIILCAPPAVEKSW